jgi:F0F1-type ATP synthase membrane subunit a
MNPLATDVVFEPFGLPVTNTMLTGTLVTIVLAIVTVVLRLSLSIWPSRAQVAAEYVIELWQSLADNAGGKRAQRFGRWWAQLSCSSCSPTGSVRCR